MAKFIISGGSGFLGRKLTARLKSLGHQVIITTRNTSKKGIDNINADMFITINDLPENLEDVKCIINFNGANLSSGRWTKKYKKILLDSRIEPLNKLIDIIKQSDYKPEKFISASAVGYYGNSTEKITEYSPVGSGFLAEICKAWEEPINKIPEDIPATILRIGPVLHKSQGLLKKMLTPGKLFGLAVFGTGSQYISWIHIDDFIDGILYILDNDITGPVNMTAPNPVDMRTFSKTLAKVIRRPCFIRIPGFVFKLFLGGMSEIILEGQKVLPEKLLDNGFIFKHSVLEKALNEIIRKK